MARARDDPNSRRRTRRHLRAPAVQSLTNVRAPAGETLTWNPTTLTRTLIALLWYPERPA